MRGQKMVAHCLFEQSGTFKNAFKRLGVTAYDYDIQNEFGETDRVVDLFAEIEGGYQGKPSIFDDMSEDDVIMSFFPCTRFEPMIIMAFMGTQHQMKTWSNEQKLEYDIKLHRELHRNYELFCKMCVIVEQKGLKMIIENPYTQPHYLDHYFCIKPTLIDNDRRINGDHYKKPTQYWFLNCKPKNNIILEPIEYVNPKGIVNSNKGAQRSMIHPQYAERFIKKYVIDYTTDFSALYRNEG